MDQAIREDRVQLIVPRAVLRIINCVPLLKRLMLNRIGEESCALGQLGEW